MRDALLLDPYAEQINIKGRHKSGAEFVFLQILRICDMQNAQYCLVRNPRRRKFIDFTINQFENPSVRILVNTSNQASSAAAGTGIDAVWGMLYTLYT